MITFALLAISQRSQISSVPVRIWRRAEDAPSGASHGHVRACIQSHRWDSGKGHCLSTRSNKVSTRIVGRIIHRQVMHSTAVKGGRNQEAVIQLMRLYSSCKMGLCVAPCAVSMMLHLEEYEGPSMSRGRKGETMRFLTCLVPVAADIPLSSWKDLRESRRFKMFVVSQKLPEDERPGS